MSFSSTQVHYISQEAEKTYLEIPFKVEGSVERIEISYQYERSDGKTVIDIGLRSPERIVGWSGGARQSFFVGLEKATPGYLAGAIPEGNWAILLGAYRIAEEGVSVQVEIKHIYMHPRWLKGDLHLHSVHSDGSYSIAESIRISKEKGLDFIALTDHNNASQNKSTLASDDEILLIPGVELTNYKGHANLLGHPDALVDFRVMTAEQASSELRQAADKGAFVSLNHPFCDDCPWEFGFDVPFDAVEVWNGPWRPINERAVHWWQEQLSAGKRIVAIGGSDTHSPHPYVVHGRPTAYVKSESESTGGILAGMRRGRVVLSSGPEETFVDLAIDKAGVGDEWIVAGGQEELELKVEVSRAKGDRLILWSDQGVEREWKAEGNDEFKFTLPSDRLFYRVESYRYSQDYEMEIATCLTNPIYLRRAVPSDL
ncbi:CehA/McbA family metallohydrolase [Cohnella lupini]|uniref:Polymerase/histidinol phosphatase N-terminal domain-containing protein n=1 Tax=Cohnella lupini TaxID=1294267 RepID=A0A3D9HNX1_9BACL|nr:CehA/McbA family metallohydrolase [Cohnella lupini]RED51178.1 hypothetical protein DFP95_14411 [Cohnella lupini]